MNTKKSLLVAAAVVGVSLTGLAGAGVVSAATDAKTETSLSQRIADKFKLNKDDVQKVIDQDRTDREANHEAKAKERLAQAVTDKKITQEQADYITKAQAEIKTLIGNTKPHELTDAQRSELKTKTEALRTWATDNKIPANLIDGGMKRHGHGMRGDRGDTPPPDAPSN